MLESEWILGASPPPLPSLKLLSQSGADHSGGVGQDHVHCHFVRCNAKSLYCFSQWEKAALHFQCILKSLLHAKTLTELRTLSVSDLNIGRYMLLHASTE